MRRDTDFWRVIVDALTDALAATRDVVIAEGRLGGLDLSPIHQIAPHAETPVSEQQGFVLVGNQQQAVRPSQIKKTFAVAILAQHPGGIQIAPFGEVLVDPIALGLDQVLDPFVWYRFGRADQHPAVALDNDVRR